MTTAFEKAVAEFKDADEEFQLLRSFIESGDFLSEVFSRSQGNEAAAKQVWDQLWKKLDALNESRNSKLKTVKDALRREVQLSNAGRRGPDGPATVVKCEEFSVSSVTRRSLRADIVMDMCAQAGLEGELSTLTYMDKFGASKPALAVEYSLNYERTLSWLKSKGLLNIIEAAYQEEESTPAVKGPKETTFLGEQKRE